MKHSLNFFTIRAETYVFPISVPVAVIKIPLVMLLIPIKIPFCLSHPELVSGSFRDAEINSAWQNGNKSKKL